MIKKIELTEPETPHIIQKIQKGIRKENEKGRIGHETKKHWSPTDSSKCPRQLWYDWKGFPKEYTDEELCIFAIGTFTHEFIQKVLETQQQLCSEFRIDVNWHGFEVAGYVDSIIFDEKEGVAIVDFKTMKNAGLGFVKNKAKIDHNKQIQMYMDITKIKKGYVVYWGKNDGEMVQQEVKYDPKIIKEILTGFKLVKKHLDKNTLPPVKFDAKNWKCAYCKYKYNCQREETSPPIVIKNEDGSLGALIA